jgi:23S rRNA-/tRNA-specific pseudouridylate synthase
VRAKARFQLVKKSQAGFPLSLLKLMPVTGRRHQLRIQCRKHGAPILGDRTYGSFSFNNDVKHETGMKRMMLHSGEVKFEYYYNRNKRQVNVESEIPPEFEALLSYRPGMDMGVHMAKLSNPGQGVRRSSLLQ